MRDLSEVNRVSFFCFLRNGCSITFSICSFSICIRRSYSSIFCWFISTCWGESLRGSELSFLVVLKGEATGVLLWAGEWAIVSRGVFYGISFSSGLRKSLFIGFCISE